MFAIGKNSHKKLHKRQSSVRSVASDTELDSILDEVEKMEEVQNKKKVKPPKAEHAGHLFTKEDEKTLKQIFDNVDKRKKEFEELGVGASQCHNSSDDECSSVASTSSKSSKNSDFEKMIDEIETENDENADEDSGEDSASSSESDPGRDDSASESDNSTDEEKEETSDDDDDDEEEEDKKASKKANTQTKKKHKTLS